MDIVSSLSIVSSAGIVLATAPLVISSRASRRRRRRENRRRQLIQKTNMCSYTYRLFGNTCPVPSYRPQESTDKLWAFHKSNCIPKEKNDSIGGFFLFIFTIIAFIFMCLIAR